MTRTDPGAASCGGSDRHVPIRAPMCSGGCDPAWYRQRVEGGGCHVPDLSLRDPWKGGAKGSSLSSVFYGIGQHAMATGEE